MIKRKAETNNKQVQTIIHCYPFMLTSNNDLVDVKCNRSCQTAASTRLDRPNSDLYPLLEFTPYQLILEGAVKEIDLPRKSLLQWKSVESITQLSNLLPGKNQHKVYKSSLKKSNCINYKTSPMSLSSKHKLSIETDTQTDISVSPHILQVDEVANVFAEVSIQTSITCLPAASVSTILPQLKSNLIHEKPNVNEQEYQEENTPEDRPIKWISHEIEDILEVDRLNTYTNISSVYETDDGTEDTDEFEETNDFIGTSLERTRKTLDLSLLDIDKLIINQKTSDITSKDISEIYSFKGKDIWDGNAPIEIREIMYSSQFKDMLFEDELDLNEQIITKNENETFFEETEQEVDQETDDAERDETEQEIHQETDDPEPDEIEQELDQEIDDAEPEFKLNESEQNQQEESNTEKTNGAIKNVVNLNNCSCGSNALKKIADQLRNQVVTIPFNPEVIVSDKPFSEIILEALNVTMTVLQTELARLIDVFSNKKDIASTSCNCIDSPLNSKNTIKVTVDEHRNTLQIKINQYTEVDEFHLTRNAPGDHVNRASNNVECECQPSYSGAAPPYVFAKNNTFYTSNKTIKPRNPIVPFHVTPVKSSCCNKISTHQSKIPTSLANKPTASVRGKRSITERNNRGYSNKTCCKDKSAGVQTELTLGDRLQSESLSSLVNYTSNKTSWNNISLPAPGTYSIKPTRKKCRAKKESTVRIHKPPSQTSRSYEPYTEMPWNDILLPQTNIFKNALSQGSCSCRNDDFAYKGKGASSTKLSKPFMTINLRPSNIPLSKSCPNSLSHKISTKSTPSNLEVGNKPKGTVSVKIVGREEIVKELYFKPKDNTMTVNLNDIRAAPVVNTSKLEIKTQEENEKQTPQEDQKETEDKDEDKKDLKEQDEHEQELEEQDEDEKKLKEQDEDENELEEQDEDEKELEKQEDSDIKKDDIEDKQKDKKTIFAPAECSCTNKIKLNIFKPDFVMAAMETCEAEMKPLRQALQELQMKVRELNIPELKGCMCTVALEEHSKCVSTLGTGRPNPNNIPHIEEPSLLNTFGPCAFFKPAKFYEPQVSFPFGQLPPPVLKHYQPVDASTYYNNQYHKDENKKKHHCCIYKKRKTVSPKHDTHKSTKTKVCEVCTNTENVHKKESKCCMFVSTLGMNSPFIYKPHLKPYENGGNKKFPFVKPIIKFPSKDSTYQYGTDCTDHDYPSKHQTIEHNKENRKHKKKKHQIISDFKTHDFDFLEPYHSVFDVQNLRPGQAVKTDPDDFLLPFKESVYKSDFRSPHSLLSSLFPKAPSKNIF
ncbi:hypothetical protein RN001_004976 [Aquatica leii]|uniref:Uncharacterized protein n=1 Tax=Aquatica leii TaxID=1421715 RepID=A0AAN7SHP7_9COLE|nr:hypothetical protein RN001_004976 [Aquatica leii]